MSEKFMLKSWTVPQEFREQRVAGIPPRREQVQLDPSLERSLTTPPLPASGDRILESGAPITSPRACVQGFGLNAMTERILEDKVRAATRGATSELTVKRSLMESMLVDGLDPELRSAILQRAIIYFRGTMAKSIPEIYSVDDLHALKKAEARGGLYFKRVKRDDGKHRYYYDEKDYAEKEGEHLGGADAQKSYVRNRIYKRVCAAGEKGCPIDDFRTLAKKYGSEGVADAIRSLGKKVRFDKGRLFQGEESAEQGEDNEPQSMPKPTEKSAHVDKLSGGRADKRSPKDFDAAQLTIGTAHESEHTDNRTLAQEIAMDHLAEDPRYYAKLTRVEKSARFVLVNAGDSQREIMRAAEDALGFLEKAGTAASHKYIKRLGPFYDKDGHKFYRYFYPDPTGPHGHHHVIPNVHHHVIPIGKEITLHHPNGVQVKYAVTYVNEATDVVSIARKADGKIDHVPMDSLQRFLKGEKITHDDIKQHEAAVTAPAPHHGDPGLLGVDGGGAGAAQAEDAGAQGSAGEGAQSGAAQVIAEVEATGVAEPPNDFKSGPWTPPKDPAITENADLLPDKAEGVAEMIAKVTNFPNPTKEIKSLRPHQIEGAERILSAWQWGDGMVLADVAGLGKSLENTQRVATPYGWKQIGALTVGDKVHGSNGEATDVLGVYPQGLRPVYRVSFSDGSSVEADDEHLWTVRYKAGGRRWQELVLTTKQLRERPTIEQVWPDRVTKLDLRGVALFLPMLSAPVEYAAQAALPLPAYAIGQLLANGGLTNGSAVLTTNAHDWFEVRRNLAAAGLKVGTEGQATGCVRVVLLGAIGIARELGLVQSAAEKRIPRLVLQASVAERIALFHGLMDADGSISKKQNRVTYHSTSRGLSEDVRELIEGLGGTASLHVYDRTDEGKPTEYPLQIRLPTWLKPFTVSRKLDRYRPGRHALPKRSAQSVDYVGDFACTCIKVAAEDQLFATEHHILTHNTNTALAAMVAQGGKRNLIVVPTSGKKNLKKMWKGDKAGKLYNIDVKDLGDIKTDNDGTFVVSYEELYDTVKIPHPSKPGKFIEQDVVRPEFLGNKWDTILFDESHTMVNPDSKAAQTAKTVQDNASKVLYMSATAYTNVADMHYLTKLGEYTNDETFKDWAVKAGAQLKGTKIHNPVSPLPKAAIAATFHVDGKFLLRKSSMEGVDSKFTLLKQSTITPEAQKTFDVVSGVLDIVQNSGFINKSIVKALYVSWARQYWEALKVPQAMELGKAARAEGKQVAFFVSFKESKHAHIQAFYSMLKRKAARLAASDNPQNQALAEQVEKVAQNVADELKQLPPPPNAIEQLVNEFGGKKEVAEIHGNTNKNPGDEQDAYQDGKKKVVVATMAKGGTGISLHDDKGIAPRVQINLSLPWSGREFNQVAGRSARLGSQSKTTIHWIVGDDPTEVHNAKKVAERLQSLGSLTAGDPEQTLDATTLAAFDIADIAEVEEGDDSNEKQIAAMVDLQEALDTGGADEAELAAATRKYFREFGEARKGGHDVIDELHQKAQATKAKVELLGARRAAEQLKTLSPTMKIEFDPHFGMFHFSGNVTPELAKAVKKKGTVNKHLKQVMVSPAAMQPIAAAMKVHDIKVDMSKVPVPKVQAGPIGEAKVALAKLYLKAEAYGAPEHKTVFIHGNTFAHQAMLKQAGATYKVIAPGQSGWVMHEDALAKLKFPVHKSMRFVLSRA